VVTLAILTFCFLIQVGNTFFKTPIECMGEKSMPESFSNLYCYVHATYSINRPDVRRFLIQLIISMFLQI